MKSEEIVLETSQGAGYRTGETTDVWNEKLFAESLVIDLGLKIKFSVRDLKVNGENASEVWLKDLIDLTGVYVMPQI